MMPIDISCNYLGFRLDSPIIVAACPLTGNLKSLKLLREAGASAAVLPSLFEEQIEHDELEAVRLLNFWTLSAPDDPAYSPELNTYNTGPAEYLDLIADARRELDMPVIASLNGSSLGGWLRYAGLVEQAGASAIELNICHVPISGDLTSSQVEEGLINVVRTLRNNIKLPIAVKLGPYYSSIPNLTRELVKAGAEGIVLFNRFIAPDIDLDSLAYVPALDLSTPDELRLTLTWLAILRDQLDISLVATSGIHSGRDVVKALLAGADAVAVASVLFRHGPHAVRDILEETTGWMAQREYRSLQQLRGSMSRHKYDDAAELSRANYMRALTSYQPDV